MQIWVDADACPREIKEMLFRAEERRQVQVTLVANQSLWIPTSPYIATLLVRDGANIADRKIVELISPGDLVITADIPLRNLFDEMRGAGHTMRGPSNFTTKDRQTFANELDRWLAKMKK